MTPTRWFALFVLLLAALAALQLWNAVSIREIVRNAENTVPVTAPADELDRQKARQDLIGKRIENDSKAEMAVGLSAGLSAAIATLVAIFGIILSLRTYLDARAKERQERANAVRREREQREKERKDRLGAALGNTLTMLVSTEERQRVVGAAGLLSFFAAGQAADRADFHLQALTALIAAARSKREEPDVRQGIRLAVEQAIRTVAHEVLIKVSWQGVILPGIDLRKARLNHFDLRDANLENARLSQARLEGADLTAARLQGASLDGASLCNAVLGYADLAGAVLRGADLTGADLSNMKVLNLDLDKAKLHKLQGWRGVPWDATRNWRQAEFDADVRTELDQIYGPAVPRLRVLMLMWEFPPMVAGGTWTACYHLVRNLRRRGAEITVVVPWSRRILALGAPPFGVEVPLITLDIEPAAGGSYGDWSPYGNAYQSPYGSGAPYGNSYGVYGGIYGGTLSGSVLFRLIGEFASRLRDYVADHPVDLIHAHDWVTFDAARAASERIQAPWIAHFHSIEADRQPDRTDPLTERIEQGAVDSASAIVAVSGLTRDRIGAAYDRASLRRIDVIPNSLSEEPVSTAQMGRFEERRVVFLGRLSRQKGVDLLGEVASQLRRSGVRADFVAYGEGPELPLLSRYGIRAEGPLNWSRRGEAFRGATVLLVPSRSEPFGMVILEAMQHCVPVIYPEQSGAAEVLQSGMKVAVGDVEAMTQAVKVLLGELDTWERLVVDAAREIESYSRRGYEDRLIGIWTQARTTSRG